MYFLREWKALCSLIIYFWSDEFSSPFKIIFRKVDGFSDVFVEILNIVKHSLVWSVLIYFANWIKLVLEFRLKIILLRKIYWWRFFGKERKITFWKTDDGEEGESLRKKLKLSIFAVRLFIRIWFLMIVVCVV